MGLRTVAPESSALRVITPALPLRDRMLCKASYLIGIVFGGVTARGRGSAAAKPEMAVSAAKIPE